LKNQKWEKYVVHKPQILKNEVAENYDFMTG